jgi:hypothetical protein
MEASLSIATGQRLLLRERLQPISELHPQASGFCYLNDHCTTDNLFLFKLNRPAASAM